MATVPSENRAVIEKRKPFPETRPGVNMAAPKDDNFRRNSGRTVQTSYLTIRTGNSDRCMTFMVTDPITRPEREPRPREPMTI